MNERERALQALAGRHFPRVGDTSELVSLGRLPGAAVPIRVERVSADGRVITVRLLLATVAERVFGLSGTVPLARRRDTAVAAAQYALPDRETGAALGVAEFPQPL